MTTVLNIQADKSTMRMMDWLLSEAGFKVVNAIDAPPANFADPHGPDVVIVNTNMRQDEKCACILALRGLLPDVSILDLSIGAELSTYDTGADEYLNKPFSADDLIARVRACATPVLRAKA
jgi:DNA-binding response OmpR family regulator